MRFLRDSRLFTSVCFTIDRVTTQHTPKCVENCFDDKVPIFVYLTFTRFSVTLIITQKTAFFLNCRLIIMLRSIVFRVHLP